MERLLVAIENTDGFTFSVTQHIPVVFSSKEEFLITLEDKIKEIQKNLKEQQKIYDDGGEKIAKIHQKIQKLQKEKKAHDELYEDLHKMMLENGALYAEMNQMQTFTLGGQSFAISDFISRGYELDNSEEYINLPQVFTLNEYFEEVEKNLVSTKLKM
jgi:hypothetical protein